MLNQTQVKNILIGIPKGVPYSMKDICQFVSSHVTLDKEDLDPYTDSRNTNYPHWHSVVQKTIYHLKENGIVQYPTKDTYIF